MQYFKVFYSNKDGSKFKLGSNHSFKEKVCLYTTENICSQIGFGFQLAFISIPCNAEIKKVGARVETDRYVVTKVIDFKDWEMWNDEKFCLQAVKDNPYALQYIDKQTEEMCMIAVRKAGWSLQYAKIQTEEMCMIAVRNNYLALKFVKNKTESICYEAIKSSPLALDLITSPSLFLQKEALKRSSKIAILDDLFNQSRKNLD